MKQNKWKYYNFSKNMKQFFLKCTFICMRVWTGLNSCEPLSKKNNDNQCFFFPLPRWYLSRWFLLHPGYCHASTLWERHLHEPHWGIQLLHLPGRVLLRQPWPCRQLSPRILLPNRHRCRHAAMPNWNFWQHNWLVGCVSLHTVHR